MTRHRFAWFVLSLVGATTTACSTSSTPATVSSRPGSPGASSSPDSGQGSSAGDSGSGGSDAGAAIPDSSVKAGDAVAKNPGHCGGTTQTRGTAAGAQPAAPAVTLPSGFTIQVVASIDSARQLVALPNGDLLVSTKGTDVYLVPNAEGTPAAPVVFTSVNDSPVHGIAFLEDTCNIAVGSQHALYSIPYADGQTSAPIGAPIAKLRTGPLTHTADDTDTHFTTSLAFAKGKLYAAVGSSCNACVEADQGRATVQELNPDGTEMAAKAERVRNAIAVTTNPATGTVWIGGAGQDNLAIGHPYEYFDALTLHAGVADYGWPDCEENQKVYVAGSDCTKTVIPRIELPAYSTLIGAAFYPTTATGKYAFPAAYRGGVFITAHGSWHQEPGTDSYYSAPRVAFVAMNGDEPKTPVDWSDPTKQWSEFVGGFQLADGRTRIGRPTGAAVGSQGSLFIADDVTNEVYRIRPSN